MSDKEEDVQKDEEVDVEDEKAAKKKKKKKKKRTKEQEEAEAKLNLGGTALIKPPPIRIRGLAQVLGYLYLGDANAAHNKEELKAQGIQYIVNCAVDDVDCFYPDTFKYWGFPISDTHDGEPSAYFRKCYKAIVEAKENKSRVLVHCTGGRNIAPTMILAYMLKSSHKQGKHLPLLAAYNFLQSKEPGAQPTDHFMNELIAMEKELFGEVSIKLRRTGGGGGGGGGGGKNKGKGRGRKGKRGK